MHSIKINGYFSLISLRRMCAGWTVIEEAVTYICTQTHTLAPKTDKVNL